MFFLEILSYKNVIINYIQTHKFNSKHALSSHLHVHFTASSHLKSVIVIMSFLSVNVMSSLKDACSAAAQFKKLCFKSNISSQFEMRMLIIKLDNLLFLENAELYYSS